MSSISEAAPGPNLPWTLSGFVGRGLVGHLPLTDDRRAGVSPLLTVFLVKVGHPTAPDLADFRFVLNRRDWERGAEGREARDNPSKPDADAERQAQPQQVDQGTMPNLPGLSHFGYNPPNPTPDGFPRWASV